MKRVSLANYASGAYSRAIETKVSLKTTDISRPKKLWVVKRGTKNVSDEIGLNKIGMNKIDEK